MIFAFCRFGYHLAGINDEHRDRTLFTPNHRGRQKNIITSRRIALTAFQAAHFFFIFGFNCRWTNHPEKCVIWSSYYCVSTATGQSHFIQQLEMTLTLYIGFNCFRSVSEFNVLGVCFDFGRLTACMVRRQHELECQRIGQRLTDRDYAPSLLDTCLPASQCMVNCFLRAEPAGGWKSANTTQIEPISLPCRRVVANVPIRSNVRNEKTLVFPSIVSQFIPDFPCRMQSILTTIKSMNHSAASFSSLNCSWFPLAEIPRVQKLSCRVIESMTTNVCETLSRHDFAILFISPCGFGNRRRLRLRFIYL